MRMHTDDEVYAVDTIFLGPPGTRLPWRARYQAYGVGAILTVVMLIIENKLGILGLFPIAWGMLAVIFLTRKITTHITYEHGLKAVLATVWNEARAPRSKRHQAVVAHLSVTDIRRRSHR
ncbi:hypothetical protein [Streptomyces sp. NPDC001205]